MVNFLLRMEEEKTIETIKSSPAVGPYDPINNEALKFENFFPGTASGSMVVSDDESLSMDVQMMPCWNCDNAHIMLRKLHGQGSLDGTVGGNSVKYDEVRCLAVVPSLVIIDGIPETLETTSSLSPIVSCNKFKGRAGELSPEQIVAEMAKLDKPKKKRIVSKKKTVKGKGRNK